MEKKVQVPAIGLIVLGILGVLSSLAALLMRMPTAKEFADMGMDPKAAERFAEIMSAGGVAVKAVRCLLGILASGFVAWAGFQMLKLQTWTACVVANILVMVPCTSCCCLIGIPVGIWGLVVLFDREVKQAFQGGGPPAQFTT